MTLFDIEIPDILIKICEKEEYAQDVKNGNIYIKEAGYFRKLEENHRGDFYDGKMPISDKLDIKRHLPNGPVRSFRKDFPGMKLEIYGGMDNDDKFPMYCTSILNENITYYVGPKEFNFKDEYLEEIKHFGKYAVLFNAHELEYKVCKYLSENNLAAKGDTVGIFETVSYCDIHKRYTLKDLNNRHSLIQFFNKDVNYQWQNECRLLLLNTKLIPEDKDYCILPIGELETAFITTIDELNNLDL